MTKYVCDTCGEHHCSQITNGEIDETYCVLDLELVVPKWIEFDISAQLEEKRQEPKDMLNNMYLKHHVIMEKIPDECFTCQTQRICLIYVKTNKQQNCRHFEEFKKGLIIKKETDPLGIPQHEPGAKLDDGKIMAGLLIDFGRALMAVSEVGTYGANKYTIQGWEKVPEGKRRYTDAMMRHILKEKIESNDKESGLLHASHACWNCLARLELLLREHENNSIDPK